MAKTILIFRGKAKDFRAFMAAAIQEEEKKKAAADTNHGQR